MRSSHRAPRRTMWRSSSVLEDHDVTNQFSAFGSVKPGCFRLWTLIFIFWVLNFSTRQIYTRGRLARVGTIHFARWVFMDNQPPAAVLPATTTAVSTATWTTSSTRLPTASTWCSATASAIRAPISCCAAVPSRSMTFKYFLRRHEVPTQVWYKAYPGLTTADLARNTRIREGLESRDDDRSRSSRRWLATDLSRTMTAPTPNSPTFRACCGRAMAADGGVLPAAARYRCGCGARLACRRAESTTVEHLRQARVATRAARRADGGRHACAGRGGRRASTAFPPNSSPAWQATRDARAASATWVPTRRRGGAGAAHGAARAADAVRRDRTWTRGALQIETAGLRQGFAVLETLADQRHGRRGAVWLHRWRQPAAHRLVRRAPARHERRSRLRQPAQRRRVPAGLSQRIWPLYRSSIARSEPAGRARCCPQPRTIPRDAISAATAAIW